MSATILRTWFKNPDDTLRMYNAMTHLFGRGNIIFYINPVFGYQGINPHTVDTPDWYTKRGFTSKVVFGAMAGEEHNLPYKFHQTGILIAEALGGHLEVSIGGCDFRSMGSPVNTNWQSEMLDHETLEWLDSQGIKVKIPGGWRKRGRKPKAKEEVLEAA